MRELLKLAMLAYILSFFACGESESPDNSQPPIIEPSSPSRPSSLGVNGDKEDVQTQTSAGFVLMGGSTEVDEAMKWMIDKSGGGDFVVIRTSNRIGFNPYIPTLGDVNSVETLRINTRDLANDSTVASYIRNAEALFIAGGDQAEYMEFWKNSLVEDAINYLILEKKVPVGGTSAGCAILGEIVFDAKNGTVRSEEALSNPYDSRVSLSRGGFLEIEWLKNTITDTHYDNPDRKGRHLVFMARMLVDWAIPAKGIGVEERTAVCIDQDGSAKVFGEGNAYFLEAGSLAPEQCVPGEPLTWEHNSKATKAFRIQGTPEGSNTFNLRTWSMEESMGGVLYFTSNSGNFSLAQ